MMDTIHFKGTPSAFAEYVINLAVQELAREHRQVTLLSTIFYL